MQSSLVVAQTFLDLAKSEKMKVSGEKLHKLVYFAHGLHLASNAGEALMNEAVLAWTSGPLIPELYNVARHYAAQIRHELPLTGVEPISLGTSAYASIKSTWIAYKGCTERQLDAVMTAVGSPWDEVWHDDEEHFKIIPNSLMQRYYTRVIRVNRDTSAGRKLEK